MTDSIVGWAHTPFGKLEQETVESLIVRVATEALTDAGVAPGDQSHICPHAGMVSNDLRSNRTSTGR